MKVIHRLAGCTMSFCAAPMRCEYRSGPKAAVCLAVSLWKILGTIPKLGVREVPCLSDWTRRCASVRGDVKNVKKNNMQQSNYTEQTRRHLAGHQETHKTRECWCWCCELETGVWERGLDMKTCPAGARGVLGNHVIRFGRIIMAANKSLKSYTAPHVLG